MNKFSDYWDKKLPKNKRESTYTVWLDDKIDLIGKCGGVVLDLGCGNGEDTKYLIDCGFEVISADFSNSSIEALSEIRGSNPLLFDMSNEEDWEKFKDKSIGTVIANLSLHYFDSKTTMMILSNIERILKPSGLLIARLNSSKDENFGANDGTKVEPNFYINNERGITKRFFDNSTIKEYFSIFDIVSVVQKEIVYIGKKKQIFEIICKNK